MQNKPLVLITDSYPCANGGGISQTLYNLFDNWNNIYVIVRPSEIIPQQDAIEATPVKYRYERFRHYGNRLLKRLNPAIQRQNLNYQQRLKKLPAGLPPATYAWVLVSTTDPIKLQLAFLMQQKFGYTVIPYFMDDWMGGMELTWRGGSVNVIAKSVLDNAPARLMISRELDTILKNRYSLLPKPTLIIHNPAPHIAEQTTDSNIPAKEKTIIYAGSIWSMHLDALILVARAVGVLRQAHDDKKYQAAPHRRGARAPCYKLIIYTSEATWHYNRKLLEGPGVEYGGFIPYNQMQEKLKSAWLLLVTASFKKEYAHFTNSSVQTKTTDYMAAGIPLLFVGPETAASARFVHEWDCGFSIGTERTTDIAEQILAIEKMPDLYIKKSQNGLIVAKTVFCKEEVQNKLQIFLAGSGLVSVREKLRNDEGSK